MVKGDGPGDINSIRAKGTPNNVSGTRMIGKSWSFACSKRSKHGSYLRHAWVNSAGSASPLERITSSSEP